MKILLHLIIGLSFSTSSLFGQHIIETNLTNQEIKPWQQLEKSIDSLFNVHLNKIEPIQGGVISIVTSDSVLLSKGYGLADLKSKRPFHPRETNVMVASVSKLLTATAIFQLIEQGKIHLNQPVSELIGDLKIENPFDQPVLIKHILTHTAGFDDTSIGNQARSLDELEPLAEHLKRKLTPIVWKPGNYFNYSNIGMVLLAHIVERVSGDSFDTYLKTNVYQPLDMDHSGFSYEEASIKNIMTRYKWKENNDNQLFLDDSYGIKYTHQIGAGGFQTTANDMTNFMQMYLNKGTYKKQIVLKPESIKTAFSPQFYYHELLDRKQGFTWKVRNSNGITYNYHSGDDTGIESILVVIPDEDIAFFFASNNNEASDLKFEIRDLILSRINSEVGTNKPTQNFSSNTNLTDLVGKYQYMNDGQSSIERLFSYLFGDVSEVSLNENAIYINDKKYAEIDELLFEREEQKLLVKFIVDEYGSHYSTGYGTYRKLAFYETPSLHVKLLLGCFAIFLISNLVWIIQYYKKSRKLNLAKLYLGLASFCLILFFALLATTAGGTPKYGIPSIFNLYFTLPLIAIVLFIIGILKVKRISNNNLISKIHLGLIILAIPVCLLVFNYYNLIGYNF